VLGSLIKDYDRLHFLFFNLYWGVQKGLFVCLFSPFIQSLFLFSCNCFPFDIWGKIDGAGRHARGK
jgi:hypothetical protein